MDLLSSAGRANARTFLPFSHAVCYVSFGVILEIGRLWHAAGASHARCFEDPCVGFSGGKHFFCHSGNIKGPVVNDVAGVSPERSELSLAFARQVEN